MKRVKLMCTVILFSALISSSQAQAIDLYGFANFWDQKNAMQAGG